MNGGKLLIRLIDVVFILLFGFIAVSQIDSATAIEPPKSTEAFQSTPDGKQTIVIGVTKFGTYPVGNGDIILRNSRELRRFLTRKVNQADQNGIQLGIRIRANWDSPVEYALAVAKTCRNLGIPKGLDVVKLTGD